MSITKHQQNNLVYLTADSLMAAGGVVHAFSTRKGGVSQGIYASLNLGANRGDAPGAVRENYRILCSALGMTHQNLVFSRQVHKDRVQTVTMADAGKGLFRPIDYEADGLITNTPNLPLVVFTADCIPILLYDPEKRAIGAVHAGWRGTALGIVQKGRLPNDSGVWLPPGTYLGRHRPRPLPVLFRNGPGRAGCHVCRLGCFGHALYQTKRKQIPCGSQRD
jgi:hypothetical protein